MAALALLRASSMPAGCVSASVTVSALALQVPFCEELEPYMHSFATYARLLCDGICFSPMSPVAADLRMMLAFRKACPLPSQVRQALFSAPQAGMLELLEVGLHVTFLKLP